MSFLFRFSIDILSIYQKFSLEYSNEVYLIIYSLKSIYCIHVNNKCFKINNQNKRSVCGMC